MTKFQARRIGKRTAYKDIMRYICPNTIWRPRYSYWQIKRRIGTICWPYYSRGLAEMNFVVNGINLNGKKPQFRA